MKKDDIYLKALRGLSAHDVRRWMELIFAGNYMLACRMLEAVLPPEEFENVRMMTGVDTAMRNTDVSQAAIMAAIEYVRQRPATCTQQVQDASDTTPIADNERSIAKRLQRLRYDIGMTGDKLSTLAREIHVLKKCCESVLKEIQ